MIKWLLTIMMFGATVGARAADSQWLLCDDDGLVLNLYEHRSGAEDRKTDLTLIFGQHQFTGSLGAKVNLQGKTGKFKGRIVLTNHNRSVAVNGLLYFGGESYPVNAILKCKTLESKL